MFDATQYRDRLELARAQGALVPRVPAEQGAEWCCWLCWQHTTSLFDPNVGIAKVQPQPVYVNEGRWVVDCPDCGGAQLACVTDRRLMCVLCANEAIGGLWRPTVMPPAAGKIEQLLALRPIQNQNWAPGEPIARLRQENKLLVGVSR